MAAEADGARVRLQIAGDDVEGGRLPGTVGPYQRGDRSFRDREAAAVDRHHPAEALAQPLDFQQPRHRPPPRGPPIIPASGTALATRDTGAFCLPFPPPVI